MPVKVRQWIQDWEDYENLGTPLPGMQYAINRSAFSIISSELADIEAEKIRAMMKEQGKK